MRFEFSIGIGEDKAHKPIPADVAKIILARVVKEAVSRFGGVFVKRGEGAWLNSKGELALEESVVLTCDVDKRVKPDTARLEAQLLAAFAGQAFNQEAVLVTEVGTVSSLETI
jgi:hypothetical protein